MSKIIDYFKRIAQIPHCSKAAERLKDFLVAFARTRGYEVETDKTGNIHIFKGMPKVCLQGHYDMVCMGKAPQIETYVEEGVMRAKESSLGADNGMAIAMMMALMDEGREIECLITADEEIGLIGANAVEFDLKADYMLNLDSEDEAEVYIGCAGGVDIFAQKSYETLSCEKDFYEITVSGLPGGHSGVEIHKNIPNAIKLFAEFCQKHDCLVASLEGGERINSIPVQCRAIVACEKVPESQPHIDVKKIFRKFSVVQHTHEIIDLLCKFPHGVLAWNDKLAIPDQSVNLATVAVKNGICDIAVSARAMDDAGLQKVETEIADLFTLYGYDVKSEGKYSAWKPEVNDFSEIVCEKMEEVFGACHYRAIHAGLECAVLSSLYPDMKIASIGPNIRSPHSSHEKVEIASVTKTYEVVKKIVDALC